MEKYDSRDGRLVIGLLRLHLTDFISTLKDDDDIKIFTEMKKMYPLGGTYETDWDTVIHLPKGPYSEDFLQKLNKVY